MAMETNVIYEFNANFHLYYVYDSLEEIAVQFPSYEEALEFYNTMTKIYRNRNWKLVKMEQRVLRETNGKVTINNNPIFD